MQDATTVLSIIQKRGERGLPLKNLYRQLYNPLLYFQAYARLYSNDGAMTPDTCKRQEDSEPHAVAKLSHLLAMQTIRTIGPVSVNSDGSESSPPPW